MARLLERHFGVGDRIIVLPRKQASNCPLIMAQHVILRFTKHKAGPAGALEAHHERTKEKYASNLDIDTAKSTDNFHGKETREREYLFCCGAHGRKNAAPSSVFYPYYR